MARGRNKVRGEVTVAIGDRSERVALTLGVLAYLQEALEVEEFEQLSEKLSKPTPKTLITFVKCVLDGNNVEYDEKDLNKLPLSNVTKWLTEMMSVVSFGDDESGENDNDEQDDAQGNLLPLATAAE